MKTAKSYFVVGRILEKIYESEIHLSIGWMYDGGIDYKIGADLCYLEGKIESTEIDDITVAIPLIADKVCTQYPDSEFAKWWVSVS